MSSQFDTKPEPNSKKKKKANRQKLFHNASKTNPHHKFETKNLNLKKINPRYLIGIDGLALTRAEEQD